MRFELGDTLGAYPGASAGLSPLWRWILVGILVLAAFLVGALMDVAMLVMALGLFNIAVVVFLLLKRDIMRRRPRKVETKRERGFAEN